MEAFKMYIFRQSRKQMTEKHRHFNNNFIDALRQIIHPSTLRNPRRIDKLKAKMLTQERMAERGWLLEKLEAMR
jgi:hypothetical protein